MGWEVDAVARGQITAAGYPEYPHALGHQIGRQAHDGAGLLCPRWERYGTIPYERVEAGQCYTIEPRLPIDGHGVATLEEIVLVHSEETAAEAAAERVDGGERIGCCEFLSRRQKGLLLVPSPS
jgi:Xaa-Pro aminopeptidase